MWIWSFLFFPSSTGSSSCSHSSIQVFAIFAHHVSEIYPPPPILYNVIVHPIYVFLKSRLWQTNLKLVFAFRALISWLQKFNSSRDNKSKTSAAHSGWQRDLPVKPWILQVSWLWKPKGWKSGKVKKARLSHGQSWAWEKIGEKRTCNFADVDIPTPWLF